jgi:tripartite-type tricarboxylate transporter receptor subunit TctC
MFGTLLSSVPYIKAGRVRALAVSSSRRASALPEVPTVAETLPGFDAPGWYGVSTTAGIRPE